MPFDFPNAPTTGTIYTPPVGQAYKWDGEKWQAYNALAPYAARTARGPNRFMNPCMDISQENGGNQVTTDLGYPADGCVFRLSGITATAYKSGNAQSPDGTGTYVYVNVGTAKPTLAATDLLALAYPIEDVDIDDFSFGSTTAAKAGVLVFSVLGGKVGTYGFSFVLPKVNWSFCGTFTIDQAYTPKKVIVPLPAQSVNAGFAYTNVLGAVLYVTMAAGSSNVGVAGWQNSVKFAPPGCLNLADTSGNSLYVTDVGLYVDPDNTGVPPPFEHPNWETALKTCQRYYEKSYEYQTQVTSSGQITALGAKFWQQATTSTNSFLAADRFKVTKRTVPTLTFFSTQGGAAFVRNDSTSTNVAVSSNTSPSAENTGFLVIGTAPAAGNQFSHHWVANARLM